MVKQIYSVKEWEEHFRNYDWGDFQHYVRMNNDIGDIDDKLPTYQQLDNVTVETLCPIYSVYADETHLTYKPFTRYPLDITTCHEHGTDSKGGTITIHIVAGLGGLGHNTVYYFIKSIYTTNELGEKIQTLQRYDYTSNGKPLLFNDRLFFHTDQGLSPYIYTDSQGKILNNEGEWKINLNYFEENRIPAVDDDDNVDFLNRVNLIINEYCPMDEECEDCPCFEVNGHGDECDSYDCWMDTCPLNQWPSY